MLEDIDYADLEIMKKRLYLKLKFSMFFVHLLWVKVVFLWNMIMYVRLKVHMK